MVDVLVHLVLELGIRLFALGLLALDLAVLDILHLDISIVFLLGLLLLGLLLAPGRGGGLGHLGWGRLGRGLGGSRVLANTELALDLTKANLRELSDDVYFEGSIIVVKFH